jgi:exonuclease VII large subunit
MRPSILTLSSLSQFLPFSVGAQLLASEARHTERIDMRLEVSETRLTGRLDTRLEVTETRLAQRIDTRLEASETRLIGRIDSRLEATEMRLAGRIETRLEASEMRLAKDLSHRLRVQAEELREIVRTAADSYGGVLDSIRSDVSELRQGWQLKTTDIDRVLSDHGQRIAALEPATDVVRE